MTHKHRRALHGMAAAVTVLALAAPTASAIPAEQLIPRASDESAGGSSSVPPPASSIAASAADEYQDLRMPDTVDAAENRGLYAAKPDKSPFPGLSDQAKRAVPSPREYVLQRNYGSPDAVDAARDLPVQTVLLATSEPSGGFDWGDAGIGAAGMLALLAIAAGSALLLTGRRRQRTVQVAAH